MTQQPTLRQRLNTILNGLADVRARKAQALAAVDQLEQEEAQYRAQMKAEFQALDERLAAEIFPTWY